LPNGDAHGRLLSQEEEEINPGPIEDAGKVAVAAVDALKTSPALLVLILLNMIVFAAVAWNGHETRAAFAEERRVLAEERAQLITSCIGAAAPR
jgi:hypothetical protein